MPIRGLPNGPCHTRPQAGRDRPEWVVAINRNPWSQSIGIAGRDRSVRAAMSLERGVGSPTEQPGGDVLFPMNDGAAPDPMQSYG